MNADGNWWMSFLTVLFTGSGLWVACAPSGTNSGGGTGEDDAWAVERAALVEILRAEGIRDARVLDAIGRVPRHEFVPSDVRRRAYENRALPIGREQTISQPYVVAAMTEALQLTGDEKVLEVGTGSGYQAAVLATLVRSVFSVEIDAELTRSATAVLERLGYDNVRTRTGDGFYGWPEAAPFDAIMVTAAAPRMPERLVDQLAEGGRILAPVGDPGLQELTLGRKRGGKIVEQRLLRVVFVPMTGAVRTPLSGGE